MRSVRLEDNQVLYCTNITWGVWVFNLLNYIASDTFSITHDSLYGLYCLSAWVWRMSRLTRDVKTEPVSRDQILRRERGLGKKHVSLFS